MRSPTRVTWVEPSRTATTSPSRPRRRPTACVVTWSGSAPTRRATCVEDQRDQRYAGQRRRRSRATTCAVLTCSAGIVAGVVTSTPVGSAEVLVEGRADDGEGVGRRGRPGRSRQVLFGDGLEGRGDAACRPRGRAGCARATRVDLLGVVGCGRGRRGSPRAGTAARVRTWPMCRRLVVSHESGSGSVDGRPRAARSRKAVAPCWRGRPPSAPPRPRRSWPLHLHAGASRRAARPHHWAHPGSTGAARPRASRSLMSSAIRWAKTSPSSRELEASRLAPCTPVQDTSPQA